MNLLHEEIDRLKKRVKRLEWACAKQNDEVTQILGKVLGFPWYKDDQENFPGATEKDGVCLGELIGEDLARLAADRIVVLEAELVKMREQRDAACQIINQNNIAWSRCAEQTIEVEVCLGCGKPTADRDCGCPAGVGFVRHPIERGDQ